MKPFQVPKYFISKRAILALKHIMAMLCRACHDKIQKPIQATFATSLVHILLFNIFLARNTKPNCIQIFSKPLI
jgi:hypothetical protein